jgi:hypothetical protein
MLENMQISEAVKIQMLKSNAALAVAKLPVSTAFIDVSQFERFAFLIAVGAIDDAVTFQLQEDTSATQTAGVQDVTDAKVIVPALGDDKWYLLEVQTDQLTKSGGYHYVTLNVTGVVDADDIATVFFLGYNTKAPVTQGSDKGEIVVVAG